MCNYIICLRIIIIIAIIKYDFFYNVQNYTIILLLLQKDKISCYSFFFYSFFSIFSFLSIALYYIKRIDIFGIYI